MAVYEGLDIITNKMPIEEREGVTHHLMDFLPMDREYSVLDFKADALGLIKQIHDRKHMPIVVGGTHYYIQSLLWRDTLLDTKKDAGMLSKTQLNEESNTNDNFLRDSDTLTLYKKLQEVDPVMANKWHENDRRKITRSLQVFFETGKRQSDLIKEQNALPDNERLRMPSCIFWVYSAQDVLYPRLDARVDNMIKGGLFDEIKGMRKSVGSETDYERGIWQAIALETWKKNVGDIAVKIAKDFFAGEALPDPAGLNSYAKEMLTAQRDLDVVAALESWEKKECDICTGMQQIMYDKYALGGSTDPLPPVIIHGPTGWEQHLRSKQHRRMRTNKAEMERDGVNWWFFRAQEFKKRKREGAQDNEVEVVKEHEGEASPAKVRRTSSGADENQGPQ
ncbi:hypothetical protein BGX27_000256 [Mortierella sp. AM989]|nr:hypothetical protein BGX27_000256 [Mortierella sp. AM989]